MPLEGEAKRQYNKDYHAKKQKEKEELFGEIERLKVLDEAGQHAPGEFNTWVELWKIYKGIDPKAEEGVIPKKEQKFVNPSAFEILGSKLTFEEWIAQRDIHRKDLWRLLETLRPTGWSEEVHKPLAEFFVQKDNTTIPFSYTETDKNKWLLRLDRWHKRLLLYPRGFRKSTVNMADAVQWILNCPDIVILVVTATRALATDFIRLLRRYFTISDYSHPTEFQLLFPDFCVPEQGLEGAKKRKVGEGDSKKFLCPKRRLSLVSPTVALSSMESGTAGIRADVIKFDDAVDDTNYIEVESREKIFSKFSFILQLLVGKFGFWELVGTRYTDGLNSDSEEGPVPDLYGSILKLNQSSRTQDLKILCAPAFVVLPEYENIPLEQLEKNMVVLMDNDPEGAGSFDALMEKLAIIKEKHFRCQQLNQPVADISGQDEYINTFTEDNIRKKLRSKEQAPGTGQTVLLVDTAMTAGRKSDYSAFAVARILDRAPLNPYIWWMEICAGHFTDMEVAAKIAELMKRWNCAAVVEEIPSTSVTFKNEVRRQMYIQGVPEGLSVTWFTPDQTPAAKETRIRGLQMLHELDLMFYCTDIWSPMKWIDLMIHQLTNYNGDKKRHKNSRGGRKDDIPDAMSYVHKFLPFIEGVHTEKEKIARKAVEEMMTLQRLKNHIFGSASPNISTNNNQASVSKDPEPLDPIHKAIGVLVKNVGPVLGFPRKPGGGVGQ
jgi:hypothetical protein